MQQSPTRLTSRKPAPNEREPLLLPEVYEAEWSEWDDAMTRFDGPETVFVHQPEED